MPSTPATRSPAALRVSGRDALDVLHRIATHALADLTPGGGRATMFCDFRGRLLHRVWVARDATGVVWLLRDDAPAADLAAFIDAHVFREDVTLADLSGSAGAPALPETERFATEVDRIRAGHPRHGHEIADEFTPFEIGRAHEVHLSKGCFTGQEALMRLVTYRSVRRRLARAEGAGPPPAVPADVTRGGERVGRLTSAAALPGNERWLGLAVLTHEAAGAGTRLEVAGRWIDVAVPFPLTRPLGLPESRG